MLTFGSKETVSSIESRLQWMRDSGKVTDLDLTPKVEEFNIDAEVVLIQMRVFGTLYINTLPRRS